MELFLLIYSTVDVKNKYLSFTLKSIEFNSDTLQKKLMCMGKMVKRYFFSQFEKKDKELLAIELMNCFLQRIPNVFYGYAENYSYNIANETSEGINSKTNKKLYISYDLINSNDISNIDIKELNPILISQLLVNVQSYYLYSNLFDEKVAWDGKTKKAKESMVSKLSDGSNLDLNIENILYDWFKVTIKDPLCQSYGSYKEHIIFLEYKNEDGQYVDLINEDGSTTYAAIESIVDIKPKSEPAITISNIYLMRPHIFNEKIIIQKFNKIVDSIKYLIIYNTGQALCTALADVELEPLLFFDFGIPNRFNRFTLHNKPYLENLPLKKDHLIVLSHWDSDHYLLAKEHKQADTLFWLEPEIAINGSCPKNIHGTASNTLTKIRNALIIKNNIASWPTNISYLQFSYGRVLRATGDYSHKHNYGLSLQMEIKNKKILVMGDNCYDLLDYNNLYDAYDILVVSHHGGISLHSKKNAQFIPKTTNKLGISIYSYGKSIKGKCNTHGHPSPEYVQFHVNNGWLTQLHTADNTLNSVTSDITINKDFIAIPL